MHKTSNKHVTVYQGFRKWCQPASLSRRRKTNKIESVVWVDSCSGHLCKTYFKIQTVAAVGGNLHNWKLHKSTWLAEISLCQIAAGSSWQKFVKKSRLASWLSLSWSWRMCLIYCFLGGSNWQMFSWWFRESVKMTLVGNLIWLLSSFLGLVSEADEVGYNSNMDSSLDEVGQQLPWLDF